MSEITVVSLLTRMCELKKACIRICESRRTFMYVSIAVDKEEQSDWPTGVQGEEEESIESITYVGRRSANRVRRNFHLFPGKRGARGTHSHVVVRVFSSLPSPHSFMKVPFMICIKRPYPPPLYCSSSASNSCLHRRRVIFDHIFPFAGFPPTQRHKLCSKVFHPFSSPRHNKSHLIF